MSKCKIVLAGEAGVGKTSLFFTYADGSFPTEYLATIGVDFRFKRIDVDGESVKLQIWDTAGQERYRGITSSYYHGANVVLLVFDITRRSTFLALRDWGVLAQNHGARILVVGNKGDLGDSRRKVSFEEAVRLAQKLKLAAVFETSAKVGESE
jgi:Ras-related protein Rab-1A